MKSPLFTPSPNRKRGLILTLSVSLLFHGSLIGVAALWRTPPVEKLPRITEVGFDDPTTPAEPLRPEAAPPSEPEPAQPEFKVSEAVDPAPPPLDEPSADDMMLSTPVPRSVSRTPSQHPAGVPSVASASRAQRGLSASGAVDGPGVGRPGPGVRWNTPKPAYPASLLLAHVQGNGSVRVTTDGSGRVVGAAIVQSTGNALLDDHTCRAARSGWSGPPNATVTVPITYQLR